MKRLLLASNGRAAIEGMKMLFDDLNQIKLAYIITASKGVLDLSYLDWHKEDMDKLGIDYEEIDIDEKNEDELREILKDKNTVYVEGGNTFYLLKAVKESGFDKVIKQLIDDGMVYVGSSAGAYIACPTIEMATWKPKQKERFGTTNFIALNLVPFLLTAHYVPEMESMLKDKILNAKYPTRILQDGQGILVEGDRNELIGEEEEIKFNADIKQELNIIDENDNVIGKDSRENVHKNGLLHREIHVWIYNKKGEILFQKRSITKDTYPGLLDASVGGHVEIGDNYLETAVKEVVEETGIKTEEQDLIYITKMRRSSYDEKTGMTNNTIKRIYAYEFNGKNEDIKLEEGKATGFEFWKIDDILNISDEYRERFISSLTDAEYKDVFEKIKELSK